MWKMNVFFASFARTAYYFSKMAEEKKKQYFFLNFVKEKSLHFLVISFSTFIQ